MVNHSLIWRAVQFYYYLMSCATLAAKKPELGVVVANLGIARAHQDRNP